MKKFLIMMAAAITLLIGASACSSGYSRSTVKEITSKDFSEVTESDIETACDQINALIDEFSTMSAEKQEQLLMDDDPRADDLIKLSMFISMYEETRSDISSGLRKKINNVQNRLQSMD